MKYLLTLFFTLFLLGAKGQESLVKDENQPEAEFHVAINPLDTNNIVISTIHGFREDDSTKDANNLRIHYTYDFGQTWNTSEYTGEPDGYVGAGDPVLSFDAVGALYLTNLSAIDGDEGFMVNTVLSKSLDGGATWELVSEVLTGFTDKPWLAIDNSVSSEYFGNIYLPIIGELGVKLYSLSDDLESKISTSLTVGDALPSVVVANDGTIFTSVLSRASNNVIYVQEFIEGGANRVHSTTVAQFPDYTFGAPWISKRFQPTQYLAIDNSGGIYDGRLYLAYTASEDSNPDIFDVFLTYSDDRGVTWSEASAVHSTGQDGKQQFYSSIYVNGQGVLILDWYDRSNYEVESKQTDFFMGVSFDGGDSFTQVQLNEVSSDFDNVIPSSYDFGIGEYHQVVATENTAISFWSDGRTNDGDLNIYMAKMHINKDEVGVKETGVISNNITISAPYPLPANKEVVLDIVLKKNYHISIELRNEKGDRVWSRGIVDYKIGEQSVRIPLEVPSGIYFVKVSTDSGYYKTMKIIKQ